MTPDETKIANTMFVRGLQDTMKAADFSAFFSKAPKQAAAARARKLVEQRIRAAKQ